MINSTKTDWQRLNRQNDDEIDYSDIPSTNEEFWENAKVISKHNKVDFTINIDEDLALWLKEKGNDSNQAVNSILRAYYLVNS